MIPISLGYPFPIQNASISFGAEPFYRMLDSLFSAGIVKSTDLAVSQNSGGANMSVDVATGTAIVDFNSPEGGKRQITNSVISNSGTPGSPGAD